MDLKDFTDLGNDIGRRVNDAVNNMNFDQLNRDIRRKVDQAFGGSQNPRDGFGGLNGKLYHGDEEEPWEKGPVDFKLYKDPAEPAPATAGVPVATRPPGTAGSIVMMILGYGMTSVFGAIIILLGGISLVDGAVRGVPAGAIAAMAGCMVPFLGVGILLAVLGTKRYGLTRRFRRYLTILRERSFCAVEELGKRIGKSARFVAKDLQKMIEKGFFPEGHLDHQKTCFIATNEMYSQYLQARESAAESAREQARQAKERQEYTGGDTDEALLRQVIAEGEAYIKTIRQANDAIYNPEISEKLYRMEIIVGKIFGYVKENPDQINQLRRFTGYYMPTTEKLVNAYLELDQQSVEGENITRAKKEIAQTLDTINEAYEKLYDSMYADVAMDVSSDIAVLKTLFAQEGLAEDAMNGGKKHE